MDERELTRRAQPGGLGPLGRLRLPHVRHLHLRRRIDLQASRRPEALHLSVRERRYR